MDLHNDADRCLLERGYKEYSPTPFDNESVVARFQKRFDDNFGKKYFINALKWSHDYVPINRRDEWWKPYSYKYEVQVAMSEDQKPINLEFFSCWSVEEVEMFVEDFFVKMKPNYYESWSEERGVRPIENHEFKHDCSTCANNVEYPPPHTCDICTSLDQEEECAMWEAKG